MGTGYAINGRFYGQRPTGVQRYARQVVSAIDAATAASGCPAPVVLAPPGTDVPALGGARAVCVGRGGGHRWEQASLPRAWRGPLLNLCNTGPAAKREQVVCIHDANVFTMPDSYGPGFRAAYRTLQPLLARRAARITTVSRDAARQVAAHLPVRLADIEVLPNGHEHVLAWDPSRSTALDGVPQGRPFVLAIGSLARHKNLALLLGLAPALDGLGLDLLLAGGGDGIFAAVSGTPAHGNVRALGNVTDDDLALLLGRATCLAFPSFTEGFGLPLVEAMALGCPVVSSDRASMPEVCGEAALMAPPDDPDAWAAHFAALAGSAGLRADLAGRGRERVRAFSWEATGRGYDELMRGAFGLSRATAPAVAPAPLPRMAVAVATKGRPDVVSATVAHLLATQTHPPAEVVVSCADPADAGACAGMAGVRVVASPPGLAAQRNAALDALAPGADAVAFFDDDFVADPGWLAAVAAFMRDQPDVDCVTGQVLADDVKGPGMTFAEASAAVASGRETQVADVEEGHSPYGCNMAFRLSALDGLRFDERLVLYGWLEDRDFGAALAHKGGRQVRLASARGVHMGAKGGRLAGDRLGYSQVVNPAYMNRKGTMRTRLALAQVFRNLTSNLAMSVRPEPHVDRLGRLRGNLRGVADVLAGRLEPERALLQPAARPANRKADR